LSKRILFIVHTPEFFISHRLPVAIGAREVGYEVLIATGPGVSKDIFLKYGFQHFEIPMSRRGKVIFEELYTIFLIYKLFKKLKPDLIHLVAIKPVLYGGIVARLLDIPTVFAISGLGTVFSDLKKGKLTRFIVAALYKFAFTRQRIEVIFQNLEDQKKLISITNIDKARCHLIKGAGVDLQTFPHTIEPVSDCVNITMASRLILEKGIKEFIAAAKIIHQKNISVKFTLVGAIDDGNPNHIKLDTLLSWCQNARVEYLGHVNDVVSLFCRSHIIVLPSYYGEGLPKVLIEAAAIGRPIVTTDHPGCRDAIIENKTGLLVPAHDAKALADALLVLCENKRMRHQMGSDARKYAIREFDINTVIQKHIKIYNLMINKI